MGEGRGGEDMRLQLNGGTSTSGHLADCYGNHHRQSIIGNSSLNTRHNLLANNPSHI